MNKEFFEKLTNVCHKLLLENESLMYYLKVRRGMTDETISTYQLGAFPEDLRHLYKRYDLDPKELRKQNIIWNADQSQFKLYPIVIPVYNLYGQPIAIGCRTLLTDKKRKKMGIPKYRNSVYKKTFNLFGLDRAVGAIREADKVFVVEGYFDAIMAHQKGILNVVATSGTIFSERQLIILSRYTNNICLLFDNDEPGRISVRKVMESRNVDGINLTCEFTPKGYKDLDEYLRNGGDIGLFREERIDFNDLEINTLW
jgi:DNA primase